MPADGRSGPKKLGRGTAAPELAAAGARPSRCPLCRSDRVAPFARAHGRDYLDCGICRLIHLSPEQRPGPAAEAAHYGTHENDPHDPRYRAFLSRLATPLLERITPGAEGLDYGSGPGPALSLMLEERGFPMRIYDPYFAPGPRALERSYDFITCTEAAEHFFHPREEFERLVRLLRPGGILAVMTEMYRAEQSLEEWFYARDPTHVSLYRPATMSWIAGHFGWSTERPHRSVVLFRKPQR